jgi:hypothetical protein
MENLRQGKASALTRVFPSPLMNTIKFNLLGGKLIMSNSSRTITSRIQRALLEIAESYFSTAEERLDAARLILKARGLAKRRKTGTPRKQPRLAMPSVAVLGSR